MLVEHNWLSQHLNDPDLVILDSRGSMAYSYAHIPNSIPLGLDSVIQSDKFGSHLAIDEEKARNVFGSIGIDGNKKVIIYGEYMDPSPARIAWTLMYYGHFNTYLLDIGISMWYKKGLPLTRQTVKTTPSTFVPRKNEQLKVSADEILARKDDLMLLDARSPEEFMSSRLPGAVLIPYTEGIGEEGIMFTDKEELQKNFKKKNITENKELVCYCALGHRGANLFMQLSLAGYQNVRLYDGSFVEWNGKKLSLE